MLVADYFAAGQTVAGPERLAVRPSVAGRIGLVAAVPRTVVGRTGLDMAVRHKVVGRIDPGEIGRHTAVVGRTEPVVVPRKAAAAERTAVVRTAEEAVVEGVDYPAVVLSTEEEAKRLEG